MQREAWPLPIRVSPARWVAWGGVVTLALLALVPLHHRLWPVSLLLVAGIPVAARIAGGGGFGRTSTVGEQEPVPSRLAALEGNGYHILSHVDSGNHRLDQVIVGPTG